MKMLYFLQTLEKNLANRDVKAVRDQLSAFHEADVAEIMDELSPESQVLLFRYMPKNFAAELFSYLSKTRQLELVNQFTGDEMVELVETTDTDVATDLLEELPANFVQRVLAKTSPEKRNKLNQFLQFKEYSAGSVMTDQYNELKPGYTVGKAIKSIRDRKDKIASTNVIYITSKDKRLLGVLSLRELLSADDEEHLDDIMTENLVSVTTETDQEEALRLIQKYDFSALPVTDSEYRLVGIITHDDALDIAEEETQEDFEKMNALAPSGATYFETKPIEQAKNRIPWLFFLLLTGMFNGFVLQNFESAFVQLPILVTFIPMLTGTGGNSGSQSSTLIIRGLAVGDIRLKDLPKVLWQEFRTAVLVGLGLSIFTFLKVAIFDAQGILVGFVIALSILVIVIFAKMIGGSLPIFAKTLGMDPALMASPLISTITDTTGLFVYFTIARLILDM